MFKVPCGYTKSKSNRKKNSRTKELANAIIEDLLIVYDVLPYWLWGTFEDDEKILPQRIHGTISEYVENEKELTRVKGFYNINTLVDFAIKTIYSQSTKKINEVKNEYEEVKKDFMKASQKMLNNPVEKGINR